MSRHFRYLLILPCLALALAGCGVVVPNTQVSSASTTALRQLKVGGAALAVEVAATDAAREQGLSDRASLPPGQGMLFTFDTPSVYGFWMNRMHFPLDFLWLRQGGIAQVTPNVPAPSVAQPNPVSLQPNEPVDAVIEVPAGWAAAHQVTAGAQVTGLP